MCDECTIYLRQSAAFIAALRQLAHEWAPLIAEASDVENEASGTEGLRAPPTSERRVIMYARYEGKGEPSKVEAESEARDDAGES